MSENCDVIVIFRFLPNLEQSGGRIPESAKVMFSVIVTFYLTKTENRTKKSRTQLSHYWTKNYLFAKNADISKIKRA